jgi:hypothetical protein
MRFWVLLILPPPGYFQLPCDPKAFSRDFFETSRGVVFFFSAI